MKNGLFTNVSVGYFLNPLIWFTKPSYQLQFIPVDGILLKTRSIRVFMFGISLVTVEKMELPPTTLGNGISHSPIAPEFFIENVSLPVCIHCGKDPFGKDPLHD